MQYNYDSETAPLIGLANASLVPQRVNEALAFAFFAGGADEPQKGDDGHHDPSAENA